eukprot:6489049-Amphidinium_carterae.1
MEASVAADGLGISLFGGLGGSSAGFRTEKSSTKNAQLLVSQPNAGPIYQMYVANHPTSLNLESITCHNSVRMIGVHPSCSSRLSSAFYEILSFHDIP